MFGRTLSILAAVFALAASAVQAAPPSQRPTAEPIHGARVDADGLTLRVGSNGCTRKESFRIRVKGPAKRPTVTALRIRPDYCTAMFRIVEFTWSRQELGVRPGAKIRVGNPWA